MRSRDDARRAAAASCYYISCSAIPRVSEDFEILVATRGSHFVLGDEQGSAFRALQSHLRRFTKDMQQD